MAESTRSVVCVQTLLKETSSSLFPVDQILAQEYLNVQHQLCLSYNVGVEIHFWVRRLESIIDFDLLQITG